MPSAPILITGVNGFLGRHLLDELVLQGLGGGVIGLDCRAAEKPAPVRTIVADIADRAALVDLIKDILPGTVFHLAGTFNDQDLASLYRTNVVGTSNLIQAVSSIPKKVRIVLASSAAVYGRVRPDQNPIAERLPPRPVSHYGISKAAMEMTANIFSRRYPHVDIVTGRLFNLIGRGVSSGLLPGRLKENILRIAKTGQDRTIHLGNLSSYRDFLDVRDAARAFLLLAQRGKRNTVYNVASGKKTRIKTLVSLFLKQAKADIEVVTDAALLKPNDPPMVYANITRMRTRTGWRPAVALERTIRDFLAE